MAVSRVSGFLRVNPAWARNWDLSLRSLWAKRYWVSLAGGMRMLPWSFMILGCGVVHS